MRPFPPSIPRASSAGVRSRRSGWKWVKRIALLLFLGMMILFLPLGPPLGITQYHPASGADSIVVAAGGHYRAGPIQRFLMGNHYRRLWTEPITVPILKLNQFDGGLRASRDGGGMQTRALHFVSQRGHEFIFRSVDKELTRLAPRTLGRSAIVNLLQDQASASNPASVLVAAPLQAAAGLPHANPQLVVLPDDSLLGPFRSRYAGMLGVLQESSRDLAGLGSTGGVSVVSTDELLPLLESSPYQHVNDRAFLTARLLDLFLNDWDRHEGQWRWASRVIGLDTVWQPIPVDRDQAFAWYDGALIAAARLGIPKLVQFGPEPNLSSLTINSVRLDGRFLGGLSRPVWDSTVAWLTNQLTDSVIEHAVRRMPEPYWRIAGPTLVATLKQRREHLPEIATRFYLLLARKAEVHGTARGDRIEIAYLPANAVILQVSPLLDTGRVGPPGFVRQYSARETREITISLHGGPDRIVTSGDTSSTIAISLIDSMGRPVPLSRFSRDSS